MRLKSLLLLLGLSASLCAQPLVRSVQWDSTGTADSITGIAFKGSKAGASLYVLRMNAASDGIELAVPTGVGAPVNATGPTVSNLTATGTTTAGNIVSTGEIYTTKNIGAGRVSASTNVRLDAVGSGNISGSSQTGLRSEVTFGSDATSAIIGGAFRWVSPNVSFNTDATYGAYVVRPAKGGSHTVTNNYGLFIQDQSGIGSSNSYSLYTEAGNVRLGGPVSMTSTLAVTGAITGSSTLTTTGSVSTSTGAVFQSGRTSLPPIDGFSHIYRTNTTSGSFPFNEFGNLVIQNNSNSPRSIVFITDTSRTVKFTISPTAITSTLPLTATRFQSGTGTSAFDTTRSKVLRVSDTITNAGSSAAIQVNPTIIASAAGTTAYGLNMRLNASAGDDTHNATGIKIKVVGGAFPDTIIGVDIDTLTGSNPYAIRSRSTAPVWLGGAITAVGNITMGDTLRMAGLRNAMYDDGNLNIGMGYADGRGTYIGSTAGNDAGVFVVSDFGLDVTVGVYKIGGAAGVSGTCSDVTVVGGIVTGCTP